VAIRFEYYNTGQDSQNAFYGINWLAQTFTPSIAHKIISVKLKLRRAASGYPGTITVGIRNTDESGQPTGDDLCAGTTDGDTLTTDQGGEWREITIDNEYNLIIGVKYAIVIRAPDGSGVHSADWKADASSPTYSGGCIEKSYNSGSSWSTDSSRDFMFEDWGEKQAPLPMHFRS